MQTVVALVVLHLLTSSVTPVLSMAIYPPPGHPTPGFGMPGGGVGVNGGGGGGYGSGSYRGRMGFGGDPFGGGGFAGGGMGPYPMSYAGPGLPPQPMVMDGALSGLAYAPQYDENPFAPMDMPQTGMSRLRAPCNGGNCGHWGGCHGGECGIFYDFRLCFNEQCFDGPIHGFKCENGFCRLVCNGRVCRDFDKSTCSDRTCPDDENCNLEKRKSDSEK